MIVNAVLGVFDNLIEMVRLSDLDQSGNRSNMGTVEIRKFSIDYSLDEISFLSLVQAG